MISEEQLAAWRDTANSMQSNSVAFNAIHALLNGIESLQSEVTDKNTLLEQGAEECHKWIAQCQAADAVVDKLPEMADGTRITPELIDTTVWDSDCCGIEVHAIRFLEYDTEFDGVSPFGDERTVDAALCYKEEEAAAEAVGGGS